MLYHRLLDPWFRRLPRYVFIEEMLKGKNVLEIGCGVGLGADFLASSGPRSVVGFDPDDAKVARARGRYHRDNLEFLSGTVDDVLAAPGRFDVICIPEAADWLARPGLLETIKTALGPEGLLYLSVRNGDMEESPGAVSYYDLIDVLEQAFPQVVTVSQSLFLGFSLVEFVPRTDEPDLALDDSLLDGETEDPGDYVALCSLGDIALLPAAVVQIPMAVVERRLAGMLDSGDEPAGHLSADAADREALESQVRDLEAELAERSQALASLEERLALAVKTAEEAGDRETDRSRIEFLEQEQEAWKQKVASLEQERSGLLARVAELEGLLAESRAEIVRREEASQAAERLADIEREAIQWRERAAKAESDHATLAAEAAATEGELSRLRLERESLAAGLEKAKEQADSAASERDALRAEVDRLEGQVGSLSRELNETNERFDALLREKNDLEQAAGRLGDLDATRAEVDRLGAEVETLRRERSELSKRLTGMQAALETAEAARRLAEETATRTKKDYDALRSQLGLVERERVAGEEERLRLLARCESLENATSEMAQRLGRAEATGSRLQRELESWRARAHEAEERAGSEAGKASDLAERLVHVEQELAAVRKAADRESVRKLQEVEGRFEADREAWGRDRLALESRIQALETLVAQAEKEKESLGSMEGRLEEERRRTKEVLAELETWRHRAGEAAKQVESVTRDKEDIERLMAELAAVKEGLEDRLTGAEARIDDLLAELGEERNRALDAERRADELAAQEAQAAKAGLSQAEADAIQAEAEALRGELARTKASEQDARWKVEELTWQLEEARAGHREQREALEAAEEELQRLRDRLQSMSSDMAVRDRELERMRAGALAHVQERNRLFVACKDKDALIESLEEDLQRAAADRQALQARCASLDERLSDAVSRANINASRAAKAEGRILRLEADLVAARTEPRADLVMQELAEALDGIVAPASNPRELVANIAAAMDEAVRDASAEMSTTVEELTGRLEGVYRELKRSTEVIRQLKKELGRRTEDLEDARAALDRWQQVVDRQRSDIQGRKAQARELRQEIRRRDREIEDLRLLVAERDEQLVVMEQELFRSGRRLAELEDEAGPRGERLDAVEAELEAEREQNRKLAEEVENLRLARSRLRDELLEKESRIEQLVDQLDRLDQQLSETQVRLDEQRKETVELGRRLRAATQQWESASAEVVELRRDLVATQDQARKAMEEVEARKERIKQLKRQLDKQDRRFTRAEQAGDEIVALRKRLEAAESRSEKLAEQLRDAQAEARRFQDRLDKADRAKIRMRERAEGAERRVIELEESLGRLQEDAGRSDSQWSEQRLQLERELAEARENLTAASSRTENLQVVLSRAKQEAVSVRERIIELEREQFDLRQEAGRAHERVAELEEERRRLVEKVGELERQSSQSGQVDELRRQVASLQARSEDLRRSRDAARKNVGELESEMARMQRNYDALSAKADELKESLDQALEAGQKRSEEVEILVMELAGAQQELDGMRTKRGELDSLVRSLRAELDEARAALAQQTSMIDDESQVGDAQEEGTHETDQQSGTPGFSGSGQQGQSAGMDVVIELKKENARLQEEAHVLVMELAGAQQEIDLWRSREGELVSRIESLEQSLEQISGQAQEARRKFEQAQGREQVLAQRVAELEASLEELGPQAKDAQLKEEQLRAQLARTRAEMETWRRQTEDAEGRVRLVSDDLDSCRQALVEARSGAERAAQEHERLRRELDGEQERRSALELRVRDLEQALEQASGNLELESAWGGLSERMAQTRMELSEVERTLGLESERMEVLAQSLAQLADKVEVASQEHGDQQVAEQVQELQRQVEALRKDNAAKAQSLEVQALDLDRLRTRVAEMEASGRTPPAEWEVERVQAARRIRALEDVLLQRQQALDVAEKKVSGLLDQLGDRDAEVLLLYGTISKLQEQAGRVRERVVGLVERASALGGDWLRAELEGIVNELTNIQDKK